MNCFTLLSHRFGSGYTLQAKVNPLLAGQETPPQTTPKSSAGSPLLPLETEDPVVNRGTSSGTFSQGSADRVTASAAGGGGGLSGGLQEMDTNALKYFIDQSFPGAVLMEEHQVNM